MLLALVLPIALVGLAGFNLYSIPTGLLLAIASTSLPLIFWSVGIAKSLKLGQAQLLAFVCVQLLIVGLVVGLKVVVSH